MKAKLLGQYRSSKTGNVVFRYELTGSPAEVEAYKAIQGEKYVPSDETGKPLLFTTRFQGMNGIVKFNKDNTKTYFDTSEADAMASLISQYEGTAMGNALAAEYAKKMVAETTALAKLTSSMTVASTANVQAEESVDDLN